MNSYNGQIVKWVERDIYHSGSGWSSKITGAYIWTVEGLADNLKKRCETKHPNNNFMVLDVELLVNE